MNRKPPIRSRQFSTSPHPNSPRDPSPRERDRGEVNNHEKESSGKADFPKKPQM